MNIEALLFLILTIGILLGIPALLLPARTLATARQLGAGMAIGFAWMVAFAVRGEGGWWKTVGWLIALGALWALWRLYLDTVVLRELRRRRAKPAPVFADSHGRTVEIQHRHARVRGAEWCPTGECQTEGTTHA